MKVSGCRRCPYMRERKYSTYHEPKNYHPIGFTHVYAYCDKNKCRCSEVKAKDCGRPKGDETK